MIILGSSADGHSFVSFDSSLSYISVTHAAPSRVPDINTSDDMVTPTIPQFGQQQAAASAQHPATPSGTKRWRCADGSLGGDRDGDAGGMSPLLKRMKLGVGSEASSKQGDAPDVDMDIDSAAANHVLNIHNNMSAGEINMAAIHG